MKWLRLYSELKDDPKMLSLDDSQFRVWIGLLCMASESSERGVVSMPTERGLAASLHTSVDALAEALAAFTELEMVRVEGKAIRLVHWEARQPDWASSQPEAIAERVRRHRERKRGSVTTSNDVTPVTCNDVVTTSNDSRLRVDTDTEETNTPLSPPVGGKSRAKPAQVRARNSPLPNRVYELFVAWCEASGIDPETVPKSDKARQLRAAKEILESGYSPEDVQACTLYLRRQDWRESPPDLPQVGRFIARWTADGRPSEPVARSKSTKSDPLAQKLSRLGLTVAGDGQWLRNGVMTHPSSYLSPEEIEQAEQLARLGSGNTRIRAGPVSVAHE